MNIKEMAEKYQDYNIKLRREFHLRPEISGNEYKTTERIIQELELLGIPYERCTKTGVVGMLDSGRVGKTLALRADIDALPVKEETGLPFASQNNSVMHACGHDGHISSLLTAARILKEYEDRWNGRVKFLFQPHEEKGPSGAAAFIEAGVMEGVDGVMGVHLWNDIEVGKISVDEGIRMATSARVKICVKGHGGHGGMPHLGVDAILAASALVMNLQSVVSRELNALDPVIISIGKFNGGTEFNVLAEEVCMEGSIKFFNEKLAPVLEEKITRIAKETARTYRAESNVEFIVGSGKPLTNHPAMSKLGRTAIERMFGSEAVTRFEKITPSDDFSRLSSLVPGLYAFVGTKNTEKKEYYPHHNPKFDIDEDALMYAAALYAQFAIEFLA